MFKKIFTSFVAVVFIGLLGTTVVAVSRGAKHSNEAGVTQAITYPYFVVGY